MNSFKRFLKYNIKYKPAFFSFLIFTLIAGIIGNFQNYFYKFFVENLSHPDLTKLLWIVLGFVGVKLSSEIFMQGANLLGDYFHFRGARDARMDVFRHLHELDLAYHSNKQSGGLIGTIKRGDQASFALFHENVRLLRIFIDFIFILIIMSQLQIGIALIILTVFLLNVLATKVLITRNIKSRIAFNEEEDSISGIIVDNLINYETVKYFAKEKYEEERLRKNYIPWLTRLWDYGSTFRYIEVSTVLLAIVGIGGTLLYSAFLLVNGQITAGDLVLVLSFVTAFFPKLTDFVFRFREVTKAYIDIDKYFKILDVPIEVKDPENPIALGEIKGEVSFDDVTFAYKGRRPIIENFSLSVKPGESVAIVGRSGAGKTTMTKLLMHFYDIQNGQITVDGVNIKDVLKHDLRKNVGIVPQEAILFNDSIGYNIGYGLDEYNPEKIKEAARLAHLDKFIEGLPEKYDTLVGERGIKLSGGQKQRLAIARMILENPQIVIFDEATSHLDSESEKLIQDSFWDFAEGKTTIIIAHRFSTIMKADRIIVMEHGKIIEEGTHEQLSKKGKMYQRLWDLQVKGVIKE